ncbi:MAG: nucleotidyltransferase family protein [Elusimicrobia bacterium]|nr:nucleotidyltransferase family protein [Elusimicrobiota bacterium]
MKTPNDLQAVLLCGGKGERLRPLTADLPKPLVPIKGKPILGYVVGHARKHAIKDFIVAVGYKAGKIKRYLERELKIKAALVDSGDVDIIKRIVDCAPHIKGDFIVLYGDTLSDVNLKELARFHRGRPEPVTITVWPLRSPFGVLEVTDDGQILSFKEKPLLDRWINIGYFYFEREALAWMKDFEHFEDFLHHLVTKGKMNAFRHTGIHITVNTHQELREAERNIGRVS